MQTSLPTALLKTPTGDTANAILRSCVHCGFCNATCPTYQLLGDELDGPRGRIYQIKQILEDREVSIRTQQHLDRCLTCRACESTCPSGVQYGRLLDIGRARLEAQKLRPLHQRAMRRLLRLVLPYPGRFEALLRMGQLFRPLLPRRLQKQIPPRPDKVASQAPPAKRHMLLLSGCVQPALAPQIDAAAVRVLGMLGVALQTVSGSGCCGAVSHHLGAEHEALDFARRNIDALWPRLQEGAEAIVITASGCATQVKDYAHLLRDDPVYADKARQVSEATRDLSEVISDFDLSDFTAPQPHRKRIAFQSPCSLQHGQKLAGVVENILQRMGYELTPVPDAHLCCGSAGTYSILQKDLSEQLRGRKLDALQSGQPQMIATANIGCLSHLSPASQTPVMHWINLVESAANQNTDSG